MLRALAFAFERGSEVGRGLALHPQVALAGKAPPFCPRYLHPPTPLLIALHLVKIVKLEGVG
eukprot:762708-Hanusia_phi.AAC.5